MPWFHDIASNRAGPVRRLQCLRWWAAVPARTIIGAKYGCFHPNSVPWADLVNRPLLLKKEVKSKQPVIGENRQVEPDGQLRPGR